VVPASVFLLCGLILFSWASLEDGWSRAWLDLSQGYAAPGLEGSGVHFRYHFWSDIILCACFYMAGKTMSLSPSKSGPWLMLHGALVFCLMACTWGMEGSRSARFLGHGAREILTYFLVCIPALLAIRHRAHGAFHLAALRRPDALLCLACIVAIGSGMFTGLHNQDLVSLSSAPQRPLTLNAAVHNFEHLLDLLLLMAVTAVMEGRIQATDHERC
jgi:hypothetical protein